MTTAPFSHAFRVLLGALQLCAPITLFATPPPFPEKVTLNARDTAEVLKRACPIASASKPDLFHAVPAWNLAIVVAVVCATDGDPKETHQLRTIVNCDSNWGYWRCRTVGRGREVGGLRRRLYLVARAHEDYPRLVRTAPLLDAVGLTAFEPSWQHLPFSICFVSDAAYDDELHANCGMGIDGQSTYIKYSCQRRSCVLTATN
jgi:hypothetical protein